MNVLLYYIYLKTKFKSHTIKTKSDTIKTWVIQLTLCITTRYLELFSMIGWLVFFCLEFLVSYPCNGKIKPFHFIHSWGMGVILCHTIGPINDALHTKGGEWLGILLNKFVLRIWHKILSVPIITDFDLQEYLGMRKGIYKEYFEIMKLLPLKNF